MAPVHTRGRKSVKRQPRVQDPVVLFTDQFFVWFRLTVTSIQQGLELALQFQDTKFGILERHFLTLDRLGWMIIALKEKRSGTIIQQVSAPSQGSISIRQMA